MSKNIYIIKNCLSQACSKLGITEKQIIVEQARNDKHGHFATNLAMLISKKNQQNPMIIATQIVEEIKKIIIYLKKSKLLILDLLTLH